MNTSKIQNHSQQQMRSPDQVMRLERMGASFQTRLSFMRQLLSRMRRENWQFERVRFDVDAQGYGTSVYTAHGPECSYSLVAFTEHIEPDQRTDRVIAEVWDGTFSLFDGVPDDADINRLRANTPKQEAGRFLSSELSLARGNKSLRLFEHVVSSLAVGHQPDIDLLSDVGYLMRTTAVYGSGKFGCADRLKIAGRAEMAAPFQAEMLAVYLIRWLTIDLVNHVSRARGGDHCVELCPEYARFLGIGNSTGLGMAPFLIKYPVLINNWVKARETAFARVRALSSASEAEIRSFMDLLETAILLADQWNVEDEIQTDRINALRKELADLKDWCRIGLMQSHPWDAMYHHAKENYSQEGQEFAAALSLEPYGELVDDLGETMSALTAPKLDPAMTVGELQAIIDDHYGWALEMDFSKQSSQQRFWYYSEDKLEPRLGDRYGEAGAELEMPLAIGRDVTRLRDSLSECDDTETLATFLRANPDYRYIVRRVQAIVDYPYGEVHDNLLEADVRPLDILRFKLAFFGVSKFDPKSDLWTRVNMYQGAPLPHELCTDVFHNWVYAIKPASVNSGSVKLAGAS